MTLLAWWGSAGKESACIAGDLSSIPGLGGAPGEGKGYPLQWYLENSGLENSMDCIVMRSQSWTRLSSFHFHFTSVEDECNYVCLSPTQN